MRRIVLCLIIAAIAAHGVVSCAAGDAAVRVAGPAFHHADGTPTTPAEDAATGAGYGTSIGTAIGGPAGAPIGGAIGALATAVVGLIIRDIEKTAMAKKQPKAAAPAAGSLPQQLAGAG